MIRNGLNFVPWKDRRNVAADLKFIYSATNEQEAQLALGSFEEKNGKINIQPLLKSGKGIGKALFLF